MKNLQLFIKSLTGTLFFLAILFVSAGRLDYWQGWLYATINIASVIINSLSLINNNELAKERADPQSGTKSWDKKIIALSAFTLIITYVVAGFDAGRFQWSPDFHWSLYALGACLIIVGEILFLLAQKENRFFSSVMRIQTDREHKVCVTGIYKFVRHPSYLGSIITAIGIPLILGSLWSFIPAGFAIILTVIRTSLEDKALCEELSGYPEYTRNTPYKLIPYIW